jgi:hypothetical protein
MMMGVMGVEKKPNVKHIFRELKESTIIVSLLKLFALDCPQS